MKRSRSLSVLGIFLLPLCLGAKPALEAGESLTYRVGWGILMGAGEIRIRADAVPPPDGRPRLQVITTTATRGFARALFPFDARAESVYDVVTGRLLFTSETSKSEKKETKTSVMFDYAKTAATVTDVQNGATPVVVKMPAGDPQDLIMSLVQTRRWNLKPGEHKDALVIFGDDFYELTIYAERYEEVRTPLGTFNTLVLAPRMEKAPPKGMFKRGGAVKVWIAQDERRLPVKFQVDFKFGAGVATLIRHVPPDGGPVQAPEQDAKDPAP
ncbi:MAG TPA: DUF3108 domain-containing protein [Opitutaceae bacterium]|nr:DUF3108 domain-containing protein [Opitutaceae bacterium]